MTSWRCSRPNHVYEVMTALGRRYARHYVDRPETHQ